MCSHKHSRAAAWLSRRATAQVRTAELAITGRAMPVQKLAEIKGLSDAKVEKLLDAARKLCASYGWQTAKIIEMQVCPALSKSSFFLCDAICHLIV